MTTYTYNDTASPPNKIGTINTTHWVKTVMDGFGRTIQTVTGNGTNTVSTVDTQYAPCGCSPLGKLSRQSQPYATGGSDAWTVYNYDASGRTTSVVLPDTTSTTTYLYQGNDVYTYDPAGKWKVFAMDAFGNLVIVGEPDPTLGLVWSYYGYDVLNHLGTVTMPRGSNTQSRTFNYNTGTTVTGLLQSATNPENGTVYYTYDSNNHLASKTDAKNQQLLYQIDAYNRLLTVKQAVPYTCPPPPQSCNPPPPTVLRTYYYDTTPPMDTTGFSQNILGRLAAVQYPAQNGIQLNELYSYNAAGQPTAKRVQVNEPVTYVDQNGDRQHTTLPANLDSTYGYHGGSGLASISYPSTMSFITPTAGPSYTYSYNSMEQLSGMTSGSTTVVSNVTYNAANQLLSMNYPGVSETRGYNALNQLITLNNGTENLTYNYPAGTNNGKISSMSNAISGETVTYTYDSLNRLLTASGSTQQVVQWDQSYVFDPFGNLLQKNIAGGSSGQPSTQVTVNNQNQITSVYGLSYDANGNQNVGAYDAENRLVVAPGMAYGYDAQNKRIWSWTGAVDTYGNTTNYTVNVYSPSGQKLGAYVIAPWFVDNSQTMWVTVPSMQVTAGVVDGYFGGRRLAAMDQLGSVGNYFPWGEDKGGTSPQDTWNYATYWRDSVSGLDYANNRYYSNAYGRFMTDDPSANNWDPANPQSWNTYAYANGDPVNGNDPDGLDCSSTGFYFNGVYQGTIGDLIGAQSSISILATAMYTESGHGKGVDVSDEEYSIGAVIMNRWEFVNKNWYLSSSAGGPSLNVSGWGTPGDSITSIVENPSQFAIYVNNASGGISLSASAQKNLNSALSSSADSSGCGDLAFALTLANGMWDERNDGNPLYLYNNLILTGFNSFNPPHSSAPYEQKAGSFGDANTFYGVPESYVSETPIRVRPRRPAPPRRPHDIQGQQ